MGLLGGHGFIKTEMSQPIRFPGFACRGLLTYCENPYLEYSFGSSVSGLPPSPPLP